MNIGVKALLLALILTLVHGELANDFQICLINE